MKGIRINRFIAESGVCSRRKAEDLVRKKLIAVNGKVISDLATLINPEDKVTYKGKALSIEKKTLIAFYKPILVLSTMVFDDEKKSLATFFPKKPRLYSIGRLDFMSEGLLLMTNDGDLANKISHPSFECEKVYQVEFPTEIFDEKVEQLRYQVMLDDGPFKPVNIKKTDNFSVEITIKSGRNRILRRFCEFHALKVRRLTRIKMGPIELSNLKPGQKRQLKPEEIENFQKFFN